jgi:hypothetical protein
MAWLLFASVRASLSMANIMFGHPWLVLSLLKACDGCSIDNRRFQLNFSMER